MNAARLIRHFRSLMIFAAGMNRQMGMARANRAQTRGSLRNREYIGSIINWERTMLRPEDRK